MEPALSPATPVTQRIRILASPVKATEAEHPPAAVQQVIMKITLRKTVQPASISALLALVVQAHALDAEETE